jgi:hypothetical protein
MLNNTNKEPYLSNEERKEPISYYSNGYDFYSCKDLSEGVVVKRNSFMNDSREGLAIAISDFITWWLFTFHHRLNGFSGTDTIKWKFEDE